MFRTFGAEVTILEFLPRMVPVEDEEVSKELTRLYKKRGIDVNTGARVETVEKTETGVKVTYTDANGKTQVKEAEKALVAVGTDACSGGLSAGDGETCSGIDAVLPVDVYVPGSPPSPIAILDGLLLAAGLRDERGDR